MRNYRLPTTDRRWSKPVTLCNRCAANQPKGMIPTKVGKVRNKCDDCGKKS